ncbi:hypothetical protein [Coleofasciculus sp.]|uniref:hypothetical protein n=1 Tax=Coleofasciculus sp. TaxID=3100458 RepID=UPI0039FAF6E4
MLTPAAFNIVEQFQDATRRVLNPRIRRHFKDIPLDDDFGSDRGQLKIACFHQDKDSLLLTCGRLLLFLILLLDQIISLILGLLGGGVEDGLKDQYNIRAANLPRVVLNFGQSEESIPKGTYGVPAEVSFRLVSFIKFKKTGQSGNVPNESDLQQLAARIRNEFGGNFSFIKGDELYIYTAPFDGFFGSQVYAYNKSEAERVFIALCRVAGKSYDPDLLKAGLHPNKRSNSRPTENVTTYDGTKKEPRWRPRVRVAFKNAICDVGLVQPVVLVDASGILANPLVRIN